MTNLIPINNKTGESDFVGGVGDSCGIAVTEYKRNNLTARKAWFFTKNSIICLGAGINGSSTSNVYTSVQQTLYDGSEVITSAGNLTSESASLTENSWVHYNGTGYRLLNSATVKKETINGDWIDIYPTYPAKEVEGDVFSIYIDHGKSPDMANYEYQIYPDISADDLPSVIANEEVRILSNTSTIQAAEGDSLLYAVFYEPGSLMSDVYGEIEVNTACIFQIKGRKLLIADPTHTLSSVDINIDTASISVILPTDIKYKGQQVEVDIISYGDETSSVPTNIEELPERLSIYPNPVSNGIITIAGLTNNEHYKITDIAGQTIQSNVSNLNKIDVSDIKSGLYLISIDKMNFAKRLIIIQ